MTRQAKHNIEGLRMSAQLKSNDTRRRAEEAMAWLYANEDIKQRSIHLRSELSPQAQIKILPREQASSASKETMIAALQKRVKEQAEEIKELKKQLEVAYGSLSAQHKTQ